MQPLLALPFETQGTIDGRSNPVSKTDYWRDLAMTEPVQPGGRIVFTTADYETDEEADAALDAFFERIIEASYDEEDA